MLEHPALKIEVLTILLANLQICAQGDPAFQVMVSQSSFTAPNFARRQKAPIGAPIQASYTAPCKATPFAPDNSIKRLIEKLLSRSIKNLVGGSALLYSPSFPFAAVLYLSSFLTVLVKLLKL